MLTTNVLRLALGLVCLAACSETKAPSTSTSSDKVSAPAPERDGTGAPPAPAASARPAPDASDPCAGLSCPSGHCDLQSVQCESAPCPPVATCVAGTHPCAATTCPTNTRCESHDGKGVCVSLTDTGEGAGVACGKVTCAAGEVCCNASCGICTPPDGVCTQQVCD